MKDRCCGALSWSLVALVVVIGGCGRGLPTVPARGVVTFNGKPVEGATVAFFREAGQGPAATALTDAQGRFDLKTGENQGAVPGQYAVTVQKDNSASWKIPDPLPEGMTRADYTRAHNLIPQPLLPLRYSRLNETPLHIEVSTDAGKNQFELKLEGTPPASLKPTEVGRPIG